MDNKVPYYRLYLNEPIRKALGINLKNKRVYIFKIKDFVYISTNAIPNTGNVLMAKAYIGYTGWILRVPTTILTYEPADYTILNTKSSIIKIEKKKINKTN